MEVSLAKSRSRAPAGPRPASRTAPVVSSPAALPLGALMLAASVGSFAQTAPTAAGGTLPTVTVRDQAEVPQTKNDLRVRRSGIGKGDQDLKDIPQTVTVQTERLMDDRNLDDLREVLRTTSGVTFQAGETGEEDVRLRGFSLQQAGDLYRDGLRDGPLYERDTFNDDRVEVLKGSASMLFGKGSTGGVVNQVSKQPFLMNQHEVDYTLGTGKLHRLTGDFNLQTGENAAVRLNAMVHDADNWGASQRKVGIAPSYRWGIGTRDEFSVGLVHLDIDGRPLYNHPWFNEGGVAVPALPARNFYGTAQDHLDTSATYATVSHVHRFDHAGQLRTQVRHGVYKRDLLASAIGFVGPVTRDTLSDATQLRRSPKVRIGESELTQVSSDYSGNFDWGGRRHQLLAGIDYYRDDARRNNNAGAGLSAPNTTVGTPNDGAGWTDTRTGVPMNTFEGRTLGLYAQDLVNLTPTLKLLAGLRFEHFSAAFDRADGTSGDRSDNLWSPRVGLIYQPGELSSYYVSYGTSYNTSADSYQFAPAGPSSRLINTPAEKSRTVEVGAKWEVFERRALLGLAAFYTEKFNERNTDPDSTATQELLSGKRHAGGLEFNLAGRFTPQWEVFFNHTWIPEAEIDQFTCPAAGCGNLQQAGDRSALTPRHSGSLWTTYRILPQLRVGGGVNYRGSQNPEGNRAIRAQSFVTLDAMAEYTINDMWSAKLNVTNLTDKLYVDTLYRGFYAPGAPRRVELTLKTLF
jgi:catecholate siderophore receptor